MKVRPIGEEDLRPMPRDPASRTHHGHLLEPAAQAAAGLGREDTRWLVSPASTSPATSGSTSPCATSTASAPRGRSRSSSGTAIDGGTKVRDLSEEEVLKIRAYIDTNFKVEGDLRREVAQDIKRKIEIGCYQGIRHRRSLPVHGQRTHTNARTRKGPKKTIAGKKKVKAKK